MKLENHHWLMIIMCLIFLGFAFYFPLANYDLLPDPIPTHFNFYGEPDGWSKKNLANVLLGPIILGITIFSMLGLTFLMLKIDDPRKLINLPISKQKKENLSVETVEEMRRKSVYHILIITLLISLLIATISFYQIKIALGQAANMGASLLGLILLLLAESIYMTWEILRLT